MSVHRGVWPGPGGAWSWGGVCSWGALVRGVPGLGGLPGPGVPGWGVPRPGGSAPRGRRGDPPTAAAAGILLECILVET